MQMKFQKKGILIARGRVKRRTLARGHRGGASPKFSTLKINYTATEYEKKDYQKQKMRSKINIYIKIK